MAKKKKEIPAPECDKMLAIHEDSQKIGEFIEWLGEQGMEICVDCMDGEYTPLRKTREQLLAEYFDIDLEKVEQERRKILKSLRN